MGEFKDGKIDGFGSYFYNRENIYYGNYEKELKHGFGIYVNSQKPLSCVIGFWYKGKNRGVCLKINNSKFSVVYKKNDKEEKSIKQYEINKYLTESQKKYMKFLEKNPKNLIRFVEEQIISQDIDLFASVTNYF